MPSGRFTTICEQPSAHKSLVERRLEFRQGNAGSRSCNSLRRASLLQKNNSRGFHATQVAVTRRLFFKARVPEDLHSPADDTNLSVRKTGALFCHAARREFFRFSGKVNAAIEGLRLLSSLPERDHAGVTAVGSLVRCRL